MWVTRRMERVSVLWLRMGAVSMSALLTVWVASQAPGATVAQHIDAGTKALENLEYEDASQEFMIALGDPRATDDELIRANLLAGITNRVLDRNVEARLNFHYVLTRAPETQLPEGTSPKIASFYALVRREVEADANQAPPAQPASPPPAPAPVDEGGANVWVWGGAAVIGASVVAVAALSVTVGLAEVLASEASRPWSEKSTWMLVGQGALFGLAIPAVGLMAGAGLVAFGLWE